MSMPFLSKNLFTPLYKGAEDRWVPASTDPSSPDFYQPLNPDPAFPRYYDTGGYMPSDMRGWMRYDKYIVNARYLRLKNLSLSYTLPEMAWTSRLKLNSIRVYVSGENLLTLTPLKNMDPETLTWGYPSSRVFSTGVNITL